MGIMDNEGHDPMGFGNVRSALPMQADPDPRAALKEARREIARLQAQNDDLILTLKQPDQVGYWQRRCEIAEGKLRAHEQAGDRK